MLNLYGVKKYFDRSLILDIPGLRLDGRMYWVNGNNGSGKSTFLRMIAGLLPFEGEIQFNETKLVKQPVSYRKKVSWADAEPLFPAFLSGTQLLRFYSNIRSAAEDEVQRLCNLFEMTNFIDLKCGTYSSGTLKKLSLILAFLGKPSLILLDEPLITLDNSSVTTVCNLVRERKAAGDLILYSSHLRRDELTMLCDNQLLVDKQTVQLL